MLQVYKKHSQLFIRTKLIVLGIVTLLGSFTALTLTNSLTDKRKAYAATACLDVYDPLPSWVISRVNENKPIYVQVAGETGVPWEMLAAVHYREFNLRRDINPSNGQGIYQMYSIYQVDAAYRALATTNTVNTENFLQQTRYAANFIQDKARYTSATPIVPARKLTVNEESINLIKSTLFSYNGRASSYAAQAEVYRYSSTNQPFEGSPYVMNKFDCPRSGMKLITSDGSNTPTVADTRLGAFTLYARLKSDSYWLSLFKSPPSECLENKVNCVWEFVNEDTGRYFYTANKSERDAVYRMNYRPIGISFHTRRTDDTKMINVYRLYNNRLGWHFWTTSLPEKNNLLGSGDWNDEGVGYKVDPATANTGDPVRRLYHPTKGVHRLISNGVTISKLYVDGYRDEGVHFTSVSRNYQAPIPTSGKQNTYRFMLNNGRHFWTNSVVERNSLLATTARFEGVAWESSLKGDPVYRVYSKDGRHLWTKSQAEFNTLLEKGWRNEGIGWLSSDTDLSAKPTYRFYNILAGNHFFTASDPEKITVSSSPFWRQEGVSWRN